MCNTAVTALWRHTSIIYCRLCLHTQRTLTTGPKMYRENNQKIKKKTTETQCATAEPNKYEARKKLCRVIIEKRWLQPIIQSNEGKTIIMVMGIFSELDYGMALLVDRIGGPHMAIDGPRCAASPSRPLSVRTDPGENRIGNIWGHRHTTAAAALPFATSLWRHFEQILLDTFNAFTFALIFFS